MSAYLQRLYDATVGTAVAPEARPAQRSSSPLLAVDQRLASPAYVASFLLGLPGPADPDLEAPPPEPDLPTRSEPTRRAPSPASGEGGPIEPPPYVLPALPEPQLPDHARVEPPREPGTAEEPAGRGATEPFQIPPTRRPETHDTRPASAPARPPAQTGERVIEEPPPADRRSVPTAESEPQQRVVAPARPQQPARLRAVPDQPPLPEPELRGPVHATPPVLRPAPAHPAEPLPPPPVPRVADQADLADQVRRLVREAMTDGGSVRHASRDQPDETSASRDSDRVGRASPARTAEAMSVIGPLGRPNRATTLYGLRLR